MADKGRRSYIAIDLKSFYASVECKERELDPMTTNLVVADKSRTEKTICLAVSPSLKSYGIPGRARLFEVMQKVKEVNKRRICMAPGKKFAGVSVDNEEIKLHPELELDYITAVPRMALYMKCSTEIYNIYLKYVAPEDIHVYSIDEVFMDVTDYLNTYRMTARELAGKIIREIQQETSIAATAGIGTNLYLCKVAMDIVAKHIEPDQNGVRIAELTEISYRKLLWAHQPITDFWRVGPGYAKKLAEVGLFTMGDVARCSLGKPGEYYNEDLLYRLFGVNAELLIDGKKVSNDYEFTADSEKMTVEIAFTFDGSSLGGKSLVTFEELYDMTNPDEPKKVTEHKDITDDGQTVTIKEVPEVPDTPKDTDTPDTPSTVKTSDSPKTGDNTNIYAYLAMLGLSCVGLGGMLYFKRRRKKS